MKNLKFNTAVLLAVGELRQTTNNPFSIYDVTVYLRKMTNSGDWSISDKNVEEVDGVETYCIPHDEVKEVFNDYFDNGIIQNLSKAWNGTYNVFQNLVPFVLTPVSFPKALKKKTFCRQPKTVSDAFVGQVNDYITKHPQTNLKKLQSRFKGHSKTCAEYANIVEALGFRLIGKGNIATSYWIIK